MKRNILYIFIIVAVSTIYGLSGKASNRKKPQGFVHRRDITLTELLNIYKVKYFFRDTSRKKELALPEVAVLGVKGIQEVGLSNIRQQTGYRGKTGDKMAVYIPHPPTTVTYMVEAVTMRLKRVLSSEPKFEEGELKVQLCEAQDVNHQPGSPILAHELIITPQTKNIKRDGKVEIPLEKPIELPETGLFVVVEWHYERTAKDVLSHETRSAALAANLSLTDSYTWTSAGDMKQTWQREGEKNSLSELLPYYKGKIFNVMMGVKVKERE